MTENRWQKFSRPLVTALGVLVLVLAMTALVYNVPRLEGVGASGARLPKQESPLVVDYARVNKDGSIVLSGMAASEATVRLMIGQQVFGEVRADQEGLWAYIHGGSLAPGQYVISAESSLEGFADSGRREWVLLDILRIYAEADRAQESDQAAVYVFGEESGVRMFQRISGIYASSAFSGNGASGGLRVPDVREESPPTDLRRGVEESLSERSPVQENFAVTDVNLSANRTDLRVQGTASSGVTVRASVEGGAPREVVTPENGLWKLTLAEDKAITGERVLVVSGFRNGVALSAPQKFTLSTPEEVPRAPKQRTVEVQKGDSLWSLAQRVYGDGSRHRKLLEANRDKLKSKNDLRPGMVLNVPE